MQIRRDTFFKKCKDDHDRLVRLINEVGEISVSNTITGVVNIRKRSFPVYLYTIGDKECLVTKKLHDYLVEHRCIEQNPEDRTTQK